MKIGVVAPVILVLLIHPLFPVGQREPKLETDYTKLAESLMRDNPSPVNFNDSSGASGALLRPGNHQFYATVVDDPWIHPYVDVFKGAVSGFDIYLTVDPAANVPGLGEIDAYVGSFETNELVADGDQPGDLFILGDYEKPYYAGKQAAGDTDTDFVYIYAFERGAAILRMYGSPSDYVTAAATDPDTGRRGTAIFLTSRGTDDLIAWVADIEPAELTLDSDYFQYETPPNETPTLESMAQLGNGGVQVFGKSYVDQQGNTYQTFLSSGPDLPGSIGTGSFYVVKWNSDGELIWARRHGSEAPENGAGEIPYAIVATTEYVFVSGHTKGNFGGPAPRPDGNTETSFAFIAQFDSATGDLLNQRRLVGEGFNGTAWSLGLDNAGEYVFVGGGTSDNGITGRLELPHTSPFIMMLRQDDLSTVWEDVIVDGVDRIRLREFAESIRSLQLSNEVIATIAYADEPGTNGVIYISGYGAQGDFLGGVPFITDVWIAKYDVKGNRLWGLAFQAPDGGQYPWGVAADADGNVYVVGQTNGAMDGADFQGRGDGFIRKMTPDGSHVWTTLIGTALRDDLQDIQIVNDRLFVTGSTQGDLAASNRGWSDGILIELDLDGNIHGSHQFGTDELDYPRTLRVVNDTIYVGGMTQGSLVAPISGPGAWDAFLVTVPVDALK